MIFLLLLGIFIPPSVQAEPAILITAPNVVHLGVQETISVQLHGATEAVDVTLYFRHLKKQPLSTRTTVNLNTNNQYQAVVTLTLDPEIYQQVDADDYNRIKQKKDTGSNFVQLAAESKLFEAKPQLTNIYLSTRRGYIFIQTDKPIYNPGELVNFRIFTLDNYMKPIDDLIYVKITNSRGLIVYSHLLRSEHIFRRSVRIPDVELAGHWKITASYYNYGMSETSVEFEVREYVLPMFEVNIEATKPYLTLNSEFFPFSITARYTYGKGADGIAYVRFGLVDGKGERTYLPGIEKQIKVEDGRADYLLYTQDLLSAAANQSLRNIEGMYLYIAATVLEKASGDLEEAESSSVKIVNSPYVVDLSKTKKHFTPGGKFSILGTTTFPDGSKVPTLKKATATVTVNPGGPAEDVLIEENLENNKGDIDFTFLVPEKAKSMFITVSVEGGEEEVIISDANITSTATQPSKKCYLSVEVQHQVLQPGQNLQVTFRDITPPGTTRPSHIYYMVLSKGRVLMVGKVQRSDLTSTSLDFSEDMVPSFRLLAYYYTEGGSMGLVADSVWVDVKDVCKGKVEIEIVPFKDLKPAEEFEVLVRTDPDSSVALSAVDSAVYILNKRNKLSPQKMFDYMNSYDLACSVGGGEDSKSVLQRVGLTYISSFLNSPILNQHKCNKKEEKGHHQTKRDVDLSKLFNSFKHADRKCCDDGRKLGLTLKSCDERLKKTRHQSESCRQAFKKCCEAAAARRKREKINSMKLSLGRVLGGDGEEEGLIDEAAIHLRSYFPQSWMWALLDPDVSGNIRYKDVTPDSITTWEVQAVAMSPSKGFCVADPKPLRVFQDFFVSVKLPYSVKRNEQLEVKAVVYNYKKEDLKVKVRMKKADGLCSAGEGDVVQDVSVSGQSAVAVYFTVVPLIIGKIPINVLAYASPSAQDRIQKELRVVGEGELVSIYKEYNIDAKTDKKTEFTLPAPEDEVPEQDSATLMSFKGGVMGESVDNCLNLDGVDNLIKLPTGCAEQTMVKMSPALHAMKYLDGTNQWAFLKAERRDEAQSMIQAGYTTVLTFKKSDGSYGAFLTRPSSNWLTAFIAKEMTNSRSIIQVRDSYIQESMSYLISKQKAGGSWDDPNPLYDTGMKGGVGQTKDEAPLTAYILIAMTHAKQAYEQGTDTELITAMEKAKSYLVQNFARLQNPYAVTITAYALSLIGQTPQEAQQATRKMMEMATCDTKRCFWNVREAVSGLDSKADAISIEATAYGLLQAVSLKDKERALRIASWLTQQRKYGGGFQSTQDTVVALEALSKFSIQNNDVEDLDLRVELCINDKETKNLHLNKYNALTQAAVQIKEVGEMSLNINGRGRGTLSILQTYRSLKKEESHCDQFHFSVQVDGELVLKSCEEEEEQLDDYYNYESNDEELAKDEPMSREEWFDLRTRRKRQAPEQPKKENILVYTVCVGIKGRNSSGMVVVDISLLSGLTPIIQDLEDNVKGTEKYIDHYDFHHNKVFLYFDKLTEEKDCLRFRVEQIIPIGLIQPAAAVIYDYYNPDRRCSTFYTAPKSSPMLSKLCEGDVCMCAEGACPRMKVTFSKNMNKQTRKSYACFSPVVDYIYTVKVLNSSNDLVFTTYSTIITKLLQLGKDEGIQRGSYREMIQRSACEEVEMKSDAEYLIMGLDSSISGLRDRFRYILNDKNWIEEIPPENKCKATRNRLACQLLQDFLEQHFTKQCLVQ
ncbi:complement C4-B isoform X1 [Astyanax mexicanus]|uniref:complement C4-B isoform X1 n=1 Tax=Astyanax mexicanus TaxID=7994 RepID=UPI0020CB4279|nr:complement C4-B isoform X1 [Astyanax mexicanus]